MNLSNAKLIFNAVPKDIVSNLTAKGIDGFCMLSQEDKWYTFKRSRPYQFSFKGAVSYNRYAKFFESEEGQLKYWMLESQLTNHVVETQDNTSQFFFLTSNLRTLCNMVPGKVRYFDINNLNWLQPLEYFGGHSLSQFFIGSKQVGQKVEQSSLKGTKRETIWEVVMREFSFSENKVFLDSIKYFSSESHEMNFDFNYRTAIHDCMDFENMALV